MARFDDAHRLDDAAALALELRSARKATVELRKAVAAFTAWALVFYALVALACVLLFGVVRDLALTIF